VDDKKRFYHGGICKYGKGRRLTPICGNGYVMAQGPQAAPGNTQHDGAKVPRYYLLMRRKKKPYRFTRKRKNRLGNTKADKIFKQFHDDKR